MAGSSGAVGRDQGIKQSWGFSASSISSELKTACEQLVADSRLPNSNVGTLVNAFFKRYLPQPYRATPGRAFDSTGAQSLEFDSLIYTSLSDLASVPADTLACSIDVHQKLGLEELRSSYEKTAQVKGLAKSPLPPEPSSSTPVADGTMGIIFAIDSDVPLEKLAEELEQLNKRYPYQQWTDVVVVATRGTIGYVCQFPHKPLGDFLPPARHGIMLAAMYVHIFARAVGAYSLNRMCAVLFPYLCFFWPGIAYAPYQEILEGVLQVGMPIASYQFNLRGALVPVPQQLRFNQFFLFPVGFRALTRDGEELARVQYLPWQDGGVVRLIGKFPIEAFLVFGGKEALSQPYVRFGEEQYSGVLPISRSQFIQMTERLARQSNLQIKPDQRPKWVVEGRGNEGSGSPFIARLFLGICRLRDQALPDAKAREEFDVAFEAVTAGLETVKASAGEVVKIWSEFQQNLARGEGVQVAYGDVFVKESIDRELRKHTDDVISSVSRVMKDRMQIALRALKLDVGFLYQKPKPFETGLAKLKRHDPKLADYINQTRSKWSDRLTKCRTALEHGTWVLPKVGYQVEGNTVRAVEPLVDSQPVTEFVTHMADRLYCFVEDMMVHALQAQMPEGVSITEIPLAERNLEIVERFQTALRGGGMPLWTILYHDSKFEAH